MTTNLCETMRTLATPYEVWTSLDGAWEHRVLQKYQADDDAPTAQWYVAARTPYTGARWIYGDCDVADVRSGAMRTSIDHAADNH